MKEEFGSSREAKDFLVRKVLAQAALENIPITEDERQLMYYSVDDPASQTSAGDPSGDSGAEEKISGLIRRAWENDAQKGLYKAAFCKLSEGDHYLSVMDPFHEVNVEAASATPVRDSLNLFLSALAVVALMFLIGVYWQPVKESFWRWLHH